MAINDITGDEIRSKSVSDAYRKICERIFSSADKPFPVHLESSNARLCLIAASLVPKEHVDVREGLVNLARDLQSYWIENRN